MTKEIPQDVSAVSVVDSSYVGLVWNSYFFVGNSEQRDIMGICNVRGIVLFKLDQMGFIYPTIGKFTCCNGSRCTSTGKIIRERQIKLNTK